MITLNLPVSALGRHPSNAREQREYTKQDVADLTASIRDHGLLQPLVVTPDGDHYTILAGHRRQAALQVLGMGEAPCVVVDADEAEALAILIGDNGQHQAVNPLREADTIGRLVESLAGQDHPYDRAATLVGKSPSWIRDRLRLRNLSTAWRSAYAEASSPISEWPAAHLAIVAALPEAVQDEVLADNESAFREGVPLAVELRRLLAEYTRDLSQVPWDLSDTAVLEGKPACNDCPKRDICEGFLFRDVTDTRKPRCLDATCFDAKRAASMKALVDAAVTKHGAALAIERSWLYQNVPLPDGIPVFREFELVPLAKAQGGFPVLRLKTLKVSFMGRASRVDTSTAGDKGKPKGPSTIEDRREGLEKRRLVRALSLFRGSLLGQPVEVGTERHPEQVTPPVLGTPALPDLIALALAFGTGRPVGGEGPPPWEETDSERLAHAFNVVREGADSEKARDHLWAVLRDPVAKVVNPIGGLSRERVAVRVEVARVVCGVCAISWEDAYVVPAVQAIPEPKAWRAA